MAIVRNLDFHLSLREIDKGVVMHAFDCKNEAPLAHCAPVYIGQRKFCSRLLFSQVLREQINAR